MNKSRYWILGMTAVAALAIIVLMAGCGQDVMSPVGPGIGGGTDEGGLGANYEQGQAAVLFADSLLGSFESGNGLAANAPIDSLKDSPFYCCDSKDKQKIGRKGGYLKLQLDNEEIFFVVPANALNSEVEIEIVGFKLHTPAGDAYIYECSPSGLVFQKPMTVNHPVDRPDGTWAVMLYSGENDPWQFEQQSPVQNGRAVFSIRHFSKYGIA